MPNGRILDITGPTGPQSLGIPLRAFVSDAASSTGWRLGSTRARHHHALREHIASITPPDPAQGCDRFLWRHYSDKFRSTFSASLTWDQIRVHTPRVTWAQLIWFKEGISRCTFITWLAVRDRLSTGARMRLWGHTQAYMLCGERNETREHLFFAYPYSFTVWSETCGRLLGTRLTPDWTDKLLHLT